MIREQCVKLLPDFLLEERSMAASVDVHEGGCLCGGVRFRTRGALRAVVACHCTQCRKQSGHYWAATNVPDVDLTIAGGGNVAWYSATPGIRRGFCKTCGSFLFWKRESRDYTSIGAGAFDGATGLVIDQHIYCADKGDYYDIPEGVPAYPGASPVIQTAG
jgi:hypothetical protein